MEAAECIVRNEADAVQKPLETVYTGEAKTIEDVCTLLGSKAEKSCKAVVYQRNADDSFVLIFTRGDIEVNETKLTNYLKAAVHPAVDIENANLCAGNIGPVELSAKATILFDRSLVGATNLICGANKEAYHLTGFNPARDLPAGTVYVGNIFQLGRRYTEAMGMTYDDENGNRVNPIMGCYGIGVGRLMASVCEEKHDQYGPIWPITIAPWEVEICALRADNAEVKAEASQLYDALDRAGAEVLLDDRAVSAGFMFSDADLFGCPVRVIVSPKTLGRGVVELATRDKSVKEDVALADAPARVLALIQELKDQVWAKVPESI